MLCLAFFFFFGFGLTSRHWYPVTAPGALKENFAFAAGFFVALARAFFFGCLAWVISALVIFVPFGGPKVAVTVLSASIVTWQVAVPVQAPVKPANPVPGAGSARSIWTWLSGKRRLQLAPGQTIPPGPPTVPAPAPASATVSVREGPTSANDV